MFLLIILSAAAQVPSADLAIPPEGSAKTPLEHAYQVLSESKLEAAIRELEKAAALDDPNMTTHVELGYAYAQPDEFRQAAVEFEIVTRQQPGNARATLAVKSGMSESFQTLLGNHSGPSALLG